MYDWKIWLTPAAIALIIGVATIIQADRKHRMDLFDKRFRCYQDLSDTVITQMEDIASRSSDELSAKQMDTRLRFAAAALEAKFLFGPSVHEVVEALRTQINSYAATAALARSAERARKGLPVVEEYLMREMRDREDIIANRELLLSRMEPKMNLYSYWFR